MKKITIIYVCLTVLGFNGLWAQVGVNTTAPSATLEVVGEFKVDGKIYLENPGDNTTIRGSKLLIQSTDQAIKQYDINISKYGPINYAQFVFNELSKDGLQDYDTKISTTDYIVSIQGYYFVEANTGDTNIMLHSFIDNQNIEGYQIYSYPNPVTGTWCIKAFGNNSEFMVKDNGNTMLPTDVDLYLNVIIYRDGFIAKEQAPVSVDMGNVETGTASMPTGF